MLFAVHLNGGVCGLIAEKQSLDCDRGVVDRLVAFFFEPVAFLTAVAVNSVTYSVYELARLSLYLDNGKINKEFIDYLRLGVFACSEVVPEVVAAAGGIVIYAVFDFIAVNRVYKIIERSVAAAYHYLVGFIKS